MHCSVELWPVPLPIIPKVIIVWHSLKKTKDGKFHNTQTKLEERFVKIWLHFFFFWVKSHQKAKKVLSLWQGFEDWQSSRRRYGPSPFNIASFFGNVVFYLKDDLHQTQVEEDLIIFNGKEFLSLSFVKLPFFRRLVSQVRIHMSSFH